MDSKYVSFVAKCKSSFKFFAESEAICQDYYPEPIKIKPFQEEWIDAIENNKRVAIIAHTGSGKCLSEGSKILMADGRWKRIENINKGESILSFNDDKLEFESSKVSNFWNNGKKKVYRIISSDGRTVDITSNHPLFTPNGWKTLNDGLNVGDYIAVPRKIPNYNDSNLEMSDARILGLFLADGGMTDNAIRISNGNKELINMISNDLNNKGIKLKKVKNSNYDYSLSNINGYKSKSREYFDQFNLLGCNAHNKRIPLEIFNSDEKIKTEFISWFWAGDGYISKEIPQATVTLCQRELLEEIQLILLGLGIQSSIKMKNANCNGKRFNAWRLGIYGDDFLKFSEKVNIPIDYKQKRLNLGKKRLSSQIRNTNNDIVPIPPSDLKRIIESSDKSQSQIARNIGMPSNVLLSMYKQGKRRPSRIYYNKLIDELPLPKLINTDIKWVKIENINNIGDKQTYDITIPDNKSFVGEGFILHNTTLMAVLYPLWKLFLNDNYEILIVANNLNRSKEILKEIKYHINNSKYLKNLKPDDPEHSWRTDKIELSTGSKVYVRPYSDSVKGVHVNLAICDEVAEFNPHDIYTRYVRTRVSRRDGRIANISTPVHENDLINKLAEGAEDSDKNISKRGYWSKTYPVMDENENSNYPEAFSEEDIELLKKENPMAFQREYMCSAIPIGGDLYDVNDIIDCYDENETMRLKAKEDCEYYLGADFAVSSQGDYTVFTVIEVDKEENNIIRWMERMRGIRIPDQISRIKELNEIFDFREIIVDETNFGQQIYQKLRDDYLPIKGQDFERKARNNLLIGLKQKIEDNTLVIPRSNENPQTEKLTDTLHQELAGFGTAETQAGSVVYKSSAKHDDTVMSLAMALNTVKENKPIITKIYHD